MDELIGSFSQLNISEKKIINKIINENDDIDNLIGSFEKINISNQEEIRNIDITENFHKTVLKFIDFFKILRTKERCSTNINFIIPKWIF